MQRKTKFTVGGGAALFMVAASLLAATPATAVPGIPSIDTVGPVEVQVDADGKWFSPGTEYIEVTGDVGDAEEFIFSWERTDGRVWTDARELEQYFDGEYAASQQCAIKEVRKLAASKGIKSWEEYEALWGTGDGGWDLSEQEWAAIDDVCGVAEWDPAAGDFEWTSESGFLARVPVDIIGTGDMSLFVQPVRDASMGADGKMVPECLVEKYAGHDVTMSCLMELDGSGGTTTINVVGSSQAPTAPPADDDPTPSAAPTTDQPETAAPGAEGTDDDDSSGMPTWLLISLIAGGVIVIAAVTTIIIAMSRRKKNTDEFGNPLYANQAPMQGGYYAAPQQPQQYGQQQFGGQQYGQQGGYTGQFGNQPQAYGQQQYPPTAPTTPFEHPQAPSSPEAPPAPPAVPPFPGETPPAPPSGQQQ